MQLLVKSVWQIYKQIYINIITLDFHYFKRVSFFEGETIKNY